ncbi:hypothetical protein V8F33_010195 [Rhypophila sp. PSN 637]
MTDDEGPISPNDVDGNRPIVTEVTYGQPRRYRLAHDDHLDTLNTHNPWTTLDWDENPLYWFSDWVRYGEEADSFERSMAMPRTLECTKRLASLARETIVELDDSWYYHSTSIPLFKDPDSGDEYCLQLSESTRLPRIDCPKFHRKGRTATPLFLLHSRGLPPSATQELQAKQERKTPRYAIQLGSLMVTTATFRSLRMSLDPDGEPRPVTEMTDWEVVLDAEDDNLSLWIVVSRQQLKDHIIEELDDETPPLPIFRGLMNEERADYDCACIIDSINRLGLDNPKAPDFSQVLDMIQNSRRIIDPAQQPLTLEQLTRYSNKEPFNHHEPVPWPADPDLEVKITHLLPEKQNGTGDQEEGVASAPITDASPA